MNPLMHHLPLDLLPDGPSTGNARDDDIRTQVWGILSTLYAPNHCTERRREHRYPFPYLIHLTPVAADGITPEGESLVVVGKHISRLGLGFYHPQPLPHRRMIASIQAGNGSWMGFLIDINWCRFTKQRWYESGGRFLQSVFSPIEET